MTLQMLEIGTFFMRDCMSLLQGFSKERIGEHQKDCLSNGGDLLSAEKKRGAAEKARKLYQTTTPAVVLKTCRDAVRTDGGFLVKSGYPGTLCDIREA